MIAKIIFSSPKDIKITIFGCNP